MKVRKHTSQPVMRAATEFQPWDYCYMLEIELKCLNEMAEYFETSHIAVDDLRSSQCCRLMANLLTIAIDQEDVEYFVAPEMELVRRGEHKWMEAKGDWKMNKHVNVNNAHRFLSEFSDTPAMRSILRMEKAWYLYNKMRFQYLKGCWN